MYLDIALGWDPIRRRCDLVYDGTRLAIDTTPVTPMIVSLGSDRRAEPDDALPDTVDEGSLVAGALNPRRGWPGDIHAPAGQRSGSRSWLQQRAKLTDDTLADAEDYAREALAWVEAREGVEATVTASKADRNAMLLAVSLSGVQRSFRTVQA